jgi:hypothetical protein
LILFKATLKSKAPSLQSLHQAETDFVVLQQGLIAAIYQQSKVDLFLVLIMKVCINDCSIFAKDDSTICVCFLCLAMKKIQTCQHKVLPMELHKEKKKHGIFLRC